MENFLWDRKSLRNDVFVKSPDKSKKKIDDALTYASFGDDGTTISVNGYGHIMQVSRFLDYGSSGFLCIDSRDNSDPYYVQSRMNDLMRSSKDPTKGLRLDLVDWTEFQGMPSMGFMYDRWP